jgi:glucosyl-dolichyl phosphate glucuronosyltransferase
MRPAQSFNLAASVIVATRNRADYLTECLRRLADQRCQEQFEIIVIDNDSTDDTPKVIEEWMRKNPKLRTFRETRIGLSAAKNAGARLARGSLLLFTDDDVLMESNWVEAYLDWFTRMADTNVLVGGPIVPVLNDLQPWPHWFDEQGLAEMGLLHYGVERRLMDWEYVWGANMALPAALFERVGPWDESVGRKGEERGTFEDTEYQDRVRAIGGTVWFCPDLVLRHRIEPNRLRTRNLVQVAFNRGRNAFVLETLHSRRVSVNTPVTNFVPAVGALAINVASWTWWTLVFRMMRTRRFFIRTRGAAFSSGNKLERMRGGRESARTAYLIGRATFAWRDIILRLVSNDFN